MRFASAISVLLVVVLAALAPACVAGWNGQPGQSVCIRQDTQHICGGDAGGIARATRPACRTALKSQPNGCGLRNFVQSQFATFRSAEYVSLLVRKIGNIVPAKSAIIVSSIGSPETDRGPPRA